MTTVNLRELATAGGWDNSRGERLAHWLSVWPCEDFQYCEIWAASSSEEKKKKKKLEPPARSGSCPHAFKAHSLHTDKPSQIVSGWRKHAHVTGWEGTQRSCGGDRVIWLQTLPVSCRLEFYAGRWSLQLALCCCQRNEHVRLSLPVSSWLGVHANSDAKLLSDIFSVFMGEKEIKHNLFWAFALQCNL